MKKPPTEHIKLTKEQIEIICLLDALPKVCEQIVLRELRLCVKKSEGFFREQQKADEYQFLDLISELIELHSAN